jgi:hypothetical protein
VTGIPLLQDLDLSPEMTGRQMRVAERYRAITVAGQRCDFRNVVPRLPSSILHFSRDIRVHSLNILLNNTF